MLIFIIITASVICGFLGYHIGRALEQEVVKIERQNHKFLRQLWLSQIGDFEVIDKFER